MVGIFLFFSSFFFFLDIPCKAFFIGIIFTLKVISDTKLSSGLFLLVHWTAVLPEKKGEIIYQLKTSVESLRSLTNGKILTASSWSSDFCFFSVENCLDIFCKSMCVCVYIYLMILLCVVLMLGGCYRLILTGDSHIISKQCSYPCDLIDPLLNVTMGRN